MNIPACADRTVYCTYPPDPYPSGEIKVTTNPSPAYQVPSGKFQILILTFQFTHLFDLLFCNLEKLIRVSKREYH